MPLATLQRGKVGSDTACTPAEDLPQRELLPPQGTGPSIPGRHHSFFTHTKCSKLPCGLTSLSVT